MEEAETVEEAKVRTKLVLAMPPTLLKAVEEAASKESMLPAEFVRRELRDILLPEEEEDRGDSDEAEDEG